MIINISLFSVFIPFVVSLLYYRKVEEPFQWFFYLLLFTSISETATYFYLKKFGNTILINNLYQFVESPALLMILKQFHRSNTVRKIFTTLSAALILVAMIEAAQKGLHQFNVINERLGSIAVLLASGFSILYISRHSRVHLLLNSQFVLSASLLIFFSVFLLIQGINYILIVKEQKEIIYKIYSIHSYVNIFTNLTFAISIWLNYRQRNFYP
jgi:hypothetical protein